MDGDIASELDRVLSSGRAAGVLRSLHDANASAFAEHPWDVVPKVIRAMKREQAMQYVSEWLGVIAAVMKRCDPEDGVLILHMEFTECEDQRVFVSLLDLLADLIERIPDRRFEYKRWCFNAIQCYVEENLLAPESLDLEEEERMLMDCDPDIYNVIEVYSRIFDFYERVMCVEDTHRIAVIKCMINLLGKPFAHLDLAVVKETKNRARLVAEEFVKLICSINPFVFLTYNNTKDKKDDDIELKNLALADLFYLILVEKVAWDLVPKIYDGLYLLQSGLHFATEFLKIDHQFITEKGLLFSDMLLEISKANIPYDYSLLDDVSHCAFCTELTKVITFSSSKTYRQKALVILKKYITSFDTRGRYLLISNIFNITTPKSLSGYLITVYKDFLVDEFNKPSLGDYYKGVKLSSFLKMFCYLPKKEESDLLELSDQIIPALNLLRYLIIRDKENQTGIGELIKGVQAEYLEPIKKGLMLSKAHYELIIKEVEEEGAKGDKRNGGSQVSVKIKGSNLPEMTAQEKLGVLHSSMTAFDVMESLLFRLLEFIDMYKN